MEYRARVVLLLRFRSPGEESFHYNAVKMHEAIYNAQGRFHISENEGDTGDLLGFSYGLLKTVWNSSTFHVAKN